MRDEAISARFYSPEPATFMDEAADLAEMLCAMIGYSFVRRPISWPARMQYIEGEQNYLLEAAHNPSGMNRAISEIASILPQRWSLLLGTSPQQDMDAFLEPIIDLIRMHPPVEILTTEPQNGRYPGVKEPIKGVEHFENPAIAIQAFTEQTDLIVVTGSLYLCGNILSYLGLNADIL